MDPFLGLFSIKIYPPILTIICETIETRLTRRQLCVEWIELTKITKAPDEWATVQFKK